MADTWHTLGQLHEKLPQQEIQAIYGGTWFLMFLLFLTEFPDDSVLGIFLASIAYYAVLCVGMGNIIATAVCMVRKTAPA
jgi:ABC-type multidrug transport system permease subunit